MLQLTLGDRSCCLMFAAVQMEAAVRAPAPAEALAAPAMAAVRAVVGVGPGAMVAQVARVVAVAEPRLANIDAVATAVCVAVLQVALKSQQRKRVAQV